MKDIVEEALCSQPTREGDEDIDASADSIFGVPETVLLGCGREGARIAAHGWDARYHGWDDTPSQSPRFPEATTGSISFEDGSLSDELDFQIRLNKDKPLEEVIPASILDCDYVILAVDLERRTDGLLAAEVAESLSPETISISIPIIPLQDERRKSSGSVLSAIVDSSDTTIPVDLTRLPETFGGLFDNQNTPDQDDVRELSQSLVGELATDILSLVSADLEYGPIYTDLVDSLESGGLTTHLRYWLTGIDTDRSDEEIASRLLDGALENSLNSTALDGGTDVITCFVAWWDVTLSQAETLKENVETRFNAIGVDCATHCFTTTACSGLNDDCRLTILITGLDRGRFPY